MGIWNVCTLCGLGAGSILVVKLEKARVDVMGLQEVRWSDVSEFSVAGRTILWSGPPEGEIRQAGVALVLSKKAAVALMKWQPVNDRLLARFKHGLGISQSLWYMPQQMMLLTAPGMISTTCWIRWSSVLDQLRSSCVGRFQCGNRHIKRRIRLCNRATWQRYSEQQHRELLNFCLGAGLWVAGSWFERRNIHQYTWYSNNGMTAKEIDHILVNTRWKAVQNCHVYCSIEFSSDHKRVVATVAIKLRSSFPLKPATLCYNLKALADPVF